MRFDSKKDPAACVAKDGSKYAVTGVGCVQDGDRHFLAATNGHVLSMVACDVEEGDVPRKDASYPKEAFAAYRKARRAVFSLNGSAKIRTLDGTASEFQAIECRFPDVLGVIPKDRDDDVVIRFDARLLRMLCDAFGHDGIELRAHRDDKGQLDTLPFTVRPLPFGKEGVRGKTRPEADGSFGVLMPIAGN